MRKAGTFFMILGTALLAAALALFLFNQQESTEAGQSALEVVPQLVQQIQQSTAEETAPSQPELLVPLELLTEEDVEMTQVEIDGHGYIGYLSLPTLNLELPVMGDWSYQKLNIAPCRFTGTIKRENLVVMAHNYGSHFGKLSKLNLGDAVYFTDMDGNVYAYEVALKDLVAPDAVEEVTAGDFDLTLFTCTYGGRSRVVVYCDRIAE